MGQDNEQSSGAIRRLALLGLAGTSIEWYDFFLYGVGAALVFPALFFPKSMPHSLALVASFLTFAFGFIAAAIGGLDSPVGALVTGVVLGIVLQFVTDYLNSNSVIIVALVMLIASLMIRPSGIFTRNASRRV